MLRHIVWLGCHNSPKWTGHSRCPCSISSLWGLWVQVGAFRAVRGANCITVAEALAAVGLTGFDRRAIGALSGGQMQRVLFARLLLQDADLILLDEPFTAIDIRTAADLLTIVRRWHVEGRTILTVLHDMEAVRANFPHTLLLAREKIAHGPTADVLTTREPVSRPPDVRGLRRPGCGMRIGPAPGAVSHERTGHRDPALR